jgi:hypothetical protein
VRATTIANRQIGVDVEVFLDWLQAIRDEGGPAAIQQQQQGGGSYEPDPNTLSGFIAIRFRDEFRPAFDAWLASRPLSNPDALGTPFEHPEYSNASEQASQRLAAEAEQHTLDARAANDRGDNYVLLTVLFAIALFFAGVSGKLDRVTNSAIALGISVAVVGIAAVLMLTYPVNV